MKNEIHLMKGISANSWLCSGRLMAPEEVKQAIGQGGEQSLVRWTLCGSVAQAFFAKLVERREHPGAEEVSAVMHSSGGFRYLLLIHQVGDFQNRWVLPLWEPQVQACIGEIAAGRPLGFSLAGTGPNALVWRAGFHAEQARKLLEFCLPLERERYESALTDLADAAIGLSCPDRLESLLPAVPVSEVCVTAVKPDVTWAALSAMSQPMH